MSADIFTLPDPNATLLEVVRTAREAGMHLIHNGRRIVVSPIVPPGWREVAVKVKEAESTKAVRLWDEPEDAAA